MLLLSNLLTHIEWEKFKLGASFFIPCLNRGEVENYVRREATRLRMEIVCKAVVERGKYGLRVWRTA
jgi:hypothetical protein